MTYTLLIWEQVPDDTFLYLIPNNLADQYRHFLVEAHQHLINSSEMNDGMKFLNTALSKENPEEGFEKYQGVLLHYKTQERIEDKHITHVYLSGFVL